MYLLQFEGTLLQPQKAVSHVDHLYGGQSVLEAIGLGRHDHDVAGHVAQLGDQFVEGGRVRSRTLPLPDVRTQRYAQDRATRRDDDVRLCEVER